MQMGTTLTMDAGQIRHYHDAGFIVLENVLDAELLAMIRQVCDASVNALESRMRAEGKTSDGINLLGKRYFISHATEQHPELWRAIFNDQMADICRATIGSDAWLHTEQFVVKLPGEGGRFAWHQDSGYTIYKGEGAPHRPYVTCWIPLDDVSEANGTVRILPYSRAGSSELIEHAWVEEEGNMVGYRGSDPGDPVTAPAGSVVVFSSHTHHCSGPNQTDRPRRSLFIAYSPEVIMNRDASKGAWGRGVPFLNGGRRIDAYAQREG